MRSGGPAVANCRHLRLVVDMLTIVSSAATWRDVWLPLRKHAKVREFDLHSLRHTFASLGRTSGESAFNVSRAMGHSRSTLVDAVCAHSLQSERRRARDGARAR